MSVSLTTVATLYGKTSSMSALRGVAKHPSGLATPLTGNFALSSFLNQYPTIQANSGVVTTVAGLAGSAGSTDSPPRFRNPFGTAVDSAGNIYVADAGNHIIRKITSGGTVSTLAGSAGTTGSTDSPALFNTPSGVAVDSAGNIYVADTYNHLIRKITSGGTVSTLAGSAGTTGSTDSPVRFYYPFGIAVDSAGNLYIADTVNNLIRKMTPGGTVSTIGGLANVAGSLDSPSRFNGPYGITVDSAGNVYVADRGNYMIRKMTPGGTWSTPAGVPGYANRGTADGTGTVARFNYPAGIAVDSAGIVYIADTFNQTVRKMTPGGTVSTLAGLINGGTGSADGTGTSAGFNLPYGIAVDSAGNLYIGENSNNTIRKIT